MRVGRGASLIWVSDVNRLPFITEEKLSDDQRKVWDAILVSRGDPSTLINPDGGLVGPFNSMVTSPTIGSRVSALGAAVRYSNQLENRLLELAIITVGAHWKSNFEWWAHSALARQAGVSDEVIDAIALGQPPPFDNDDEQVVHAFASELVSSGKVGSSVFDQAAELLGPQGLVDLVTTVGYYSLISMTLNAFEVRVPDDATPTWS